MLEVSTGEAKPLSEGVPSEKLIQIKGRAKRIRLPGFGKECFAWMGKARETGTCGPCSATWKSSLQLLGMYFSLRLLR